MKVDELDLLELTYSKVHDVLSLERLNMTSAGTESLKDALKALRKLHRKYEKIEREKRMIVI